MAIGTSRYRKTTRITDADGKTYLGPRRSRVYSLRGSDVFYDVQALDNLQKIAYRHFGSAELWWVVADFNDTIDPFQELEQGTTIRLPNSARLWMEVLA